MAKGQKNSGREAKKPKADKKQTSKVAPPPPRPPASTSKADK
jgi:hypothetical protein